MAMKNSHLAERFGIEGMSGADAGKLFDGAFDAIVTQQRAATRSRSVALAISKSRRALLARAAILNGRKRFRSLP